MAILADDAHDSVLQINKKKQNRELSYASEHEASRKRQDKIGRCLNPGR
jgi:hypothetical protein